MRRKSGLVGNVLHMVSLFVSQKSSVCIWKSGHEPR